MTRTPDHQQFSNVETVEIDLSENRRSSLGKWSVWGGVAVAIVVAAVTWSSQESTGAVRLETGEARRGNLTVTVTSTGQLEPTNQVEVGIEVSGTIETVEVDYNAQVARGQILARLDASKLEAAVLQAKAALESAQANVVQAQATVGEARSRLERLRQLADLSGGRLPSGLELETAEAALQRAQADETSATAQVSQAQADLASRQTDLAKAIIYSPVDGTVLARNIEPGQTVAASLQTPVLFTLAENLTRMELHVYVDEADVGKVAEGQQATFSVDAYPNRTFRGQITQVRFDSQTVDGVVTYETILRVDNSDLLLRPGMTATADIIVSSVEEAVLVPNAALRFTPPVAAKSEESGGSLVEMLLPRRPNRAARQNGGSEDGSGQRVWVSRDGQLVAIPVIVGATDWTMTEILEGDIEPGMALVVDLIGGAP